MARKEIVAIAADASLESVRSPASVAQIESILSEHSATLQPLFPAPSSGVLEAAPVLNDIEREQARYFSVRAPDDEAEAVAEKLRNSGRFETVYVKPAPENPLAPDAGRLSKDTPLTPRAALSARPSRAINIPNYLSLQKYLAAAPSGVDAPYAWSLPGGKGKGVRIIDIEGGWQFSHVDLRQSSGGLLAGQQYPGKDWRDHGTAVLGEIGGDTNSFGVVGIAPEAMLSAISHNGLGSAGAIIAATNHLNPGDVLLLEMHRAGPRYNFQERDDQAGYIAVEWWPDDLLAIRSAIAKGIVIIEAAGNGRENLDDQLYNHRPPSFPASWRNPFQGAMDSGAIVVGAGAPPGGAHGIDRSRLDFSNYGSRVDCQAWGRGVVTTGYGDLFHSPQSPSNEDYMYTAQFSGTSSASPIVTGAVACIQGILKAQGKIVAPLQMRTALRETGSPQQPSASAPLSQRIGSRPDIRQLLAHLSQVS